MTNLQSDLEIMEIISTIKGTYPTEAAILREHFLTTRDTSTQKLLAVAVDPVWAKAIEVVELFNAQATEHNSIEHQRLEAYKERTEIFKSSILPKLIPMMVILSGGLAWLMLVALANFLEIDWRDIPMLTSGGNNGSVE